MNSTVSLLYMALAIMMFLLFVLIIAFVMLKIKEKKSKQEETMVEQENKNAKAVVKSTVKVAKEYETKSIFDFMEFENIKDNMIVQKDGKRYLMAIECQGVNYDLMSEVEKTSTEQSFSIFLNTLKEPIQIYIQTRTVNLEKNIQQYKERVNKIRESLNLKEYKLKQYMEQDTKDEKKLKDKQFEVFREKNLYTYGKDIIADSERMSLNKNVLKKKYYIIIKYFYEPIDKEEGDVLSEEEIRDTAFSNLYTRAASIIRVLAGVGIVGKALDSFELVDLLYNAYNRDDSEVFGIDKAIEAGYNDIYVDAQSIINKKIEALNKEIEKQSKEVANKVINEVVDEKERQLREIENNFENIIEELAIKAIQEEKNHIPLEIKEKAIKKIKKEGEKKTDGKKTTKQSTRKNS